MLITSFNSPRIIVLWTHKSDVTPSETVIVIVFKVDESFVRFLSSDGRLIYKDPCTGLYCTTFIQCPLTNLIVQPEPSEIQEAILFCMSWLAILISSSKSNTMRTIFGELLKYVMLLWLLDHLVSYFRMWCSVFQQNSDLSSDASPVLICMQRLFFFQYCFIESEWLLQMILWIHLWIVVVVEWYYLQILELSVWHSFWESFYLSDSFILR